MKKIIILTIIIIGIIYLIKKVDSSISKEFTKFAQVVQEDYPQKPELPKKNIEQRQVVTESKTNVVPPPKLSKQKDLNVENKPDTLDLIVPEKVEQVIEDGKKIAQLGQEVICDTYIPRCVNFQYFFKDVPEDLWDQQVSCLTRYSNCIDKSKYEIPSDEEIISLYQAPHNDMEYQEYLKKKRIQDGDPVKEYSY